MDDVECRIQLQFCERELEEKSALLDTLKRTVLTTVEENNDLKEHNAALKRVQQLLMERVAETQSESERFLKEKVEIATQNAQLLTSLREIGQKMERLQLELATCQGSSSSQRPSSAAADDAAADTSGASASSTSRSHTPLEQVASSDQEKKTEPFGPQASAASAAAVAPAVAASKTLCTSCRRASVRASTASPLSPQALSRRQGSGMGSSMDSGRDSAVGSAASVSSSADGGGDGSGSDDSSDGDLETWEDYAWALRTTRATMRALRRQHRRECETYEQRIRELEEAMRQQQHHHARSRDAMPARHAPTQKLAPVTASTGVSKEDGRAPAGDAGDVGGRSSSSTDRSSDGGSTGVRSSSTSNSGKANSGLWSWISNISLLGGFSEPVYEHRKVHHVLQL